MKKINCSYTQRENILLILLNKLTKEYKKLLDFTRRSRPFKIVEIHELSDIPGETKFIIQITNKNSIIKLSAAQLISKYDLNDFFDFHAEMIRQAALGRLRIFLKLVNNNYPIYKIISKKFVTRTKEYIFTLETTDQLRFTRTANEIFKDEKLLTGLSPEDIFDVGYVSGSEFITKEETALLKMKQNKIHQ